jgi:hypothetical protein
MWTWLLKAPGSVGSITGRNQATINTSLETFGSGFTGQFAVSRNASTEEISKYLLFVASDDASFSTASDLLQTEALGLEPIAM